MVSCTYSKCVSLHRKLLLLNLMKIHTLLYHQVSYSNLNNYIQENKEEDQFKPIRTSINKEFNVQQPKKCCMKLRFQFEISFLVDP